MSESKDLLRKWEEKGGCPSCLSWFPGLAWEDLLQAEERGSLYAGECKRYPPAAGPRKSEDRECLSNAYWTRTLNTDWCGEWKISARVALLCSEGPRLVPAEETGPEAK